MRKLNAMLTPLTLEGGGMKTLAATNSLTRRVTHCFTFVVLLSIYPPPSYASDKIQPAQVCPARGLEIPAEVPYQRMGEIPGWEQSGVSGALHRVGKAFYGQDIVTRGAADCAVLDFVREDRSRVVKDSIDITNVYRNPGCPLTELSYCYVLYPNGRFDRMSGEKIIGFTLPEKGREGCAHYSRRVRGAWRIDFGAGRYIPVAPEKLICDRPEAGDSCYDCSMHGLDGLHCTDQ